MNEQNEDPFQVTCNLTPGVMVLGLDEKAIERLTFRLGVIEKTMVERCGVLAAGNIAKLEGELISHIQICRDFVDVVRELLTLLRQEQGIASPPNPEATGAE